MMHSKSRVVTCTQKVSATRELVTIVIHYAELDEYRRTQLTGPTTSEPQLKEYVKLETGSLKRDYREKIRKRELNLTALEVRARTGHTHTHTHSVTKHREAAADNIPLTHNR